MGKVEREAKVACATRVKALKEAKEPAKCCEEVEAHLQALQGEQAKLAEQHRLHEDGLEAREAKLAAREERLSQEANRLSMQQARLEEQEKEAASRKVLLDAHWEALAAAERKKVAELARFPDVELKIRMALCSLYRDGFNKPLATRDGGFAALATELAVALEDADLKVDLFFAAVTCVFSHLHLREPGFDLGSAILAVPVKARDCAAEAVKGPVEALVKRFAGLQLLRLRMPLKPTTGKTTPLTSTTSPLRRGRPVTAPSDFFSLSFPAMHIVPRGVVKIICIFLNL
ncbi:hypothetical protein ZWY2020_034511 [Hordeum vulgare]|nr:hypothetical protein ZWY2020_034511 [Hordeum vulgare]